MKTNNDANVVSVVTGEIATSPHNRRKSSEHSEHSEKRMDRQSLDLGGGE
jgi:hypothetical protein